MRSIVLSKPVASHVVLGLLFASVVVAHGQSHDGQDHGSQDDQAVQDGFEYPPTYFAHPDHAGLLYAHIALMTLGWIFALPVAVMLSLAKSRYALMSQLSFLVVNAVGLLFSTLYNSKTPDLYPNNAHHRIGWIATCIISIQVVVSFLPRIASAVKGEALSEEKYSFLSSPSTDSEETFHHRLFSDTHRPSNDSGQGSEPNTESLRSNSLNIDCDIERPSMLDLDRALNKESRNPPTSPPWRRISGWAEQAISSRFWKVIDLGNNIIDRTILPLGFVAFATGIITFGRFFEGHAIFNGLAHWIKGGIFFWLGLLNLGRWSGSFGDLGWAWNLRPKTRQGQRWIPSAEFVESALIFFYGSTNIFLEHLSSTDGTWSSTDLEHLSITVLFLGGGLCGMLVESSLVRDLLNTTTAADFRYPHAHDQLDEERQRQQPPATYEFSLNPIPALVILLLGIMMGGHHQASMISTMVHKQWGDLLLGASCARGLTYILIYLKPPTSIHPSRPPTELLSSFGLIAGGIIFMASSSDVIQGMIHYDLDAMSIYTVTLGVVGLLMAWELVVLAIKGWAVRKEAQFIRYEFA